jgi:polyhydroxyalkanoate synthase
MLHLGLAAAALADPSFKKNRKLNDAFWEEPEGRDIKASMETVIKGIKNYQLHEFARPKTSAPVVMKQGQVRVFHYAAKKQAHARMLVIPSMINGSEILDLMPGRSFASWFADQGTDVFLLDWGNLTKDKCLQSIDIALSTRVKKILDWLKPQSDLPLTGVGYCMGGLLLAATDAMYPAYFDKLCFIATPWDFKKDSKGNFSEALQNWAHEGLPQIMHLDYMPAIWLQMLFAGVDPEQIARKFSAFAHKDQNTEEAKLFVAVEDWVNGGSDLPSAVVQQTVGGWYIHNTPAKNAWSVNGVNVDPSLIKKPSYVIIPGRDKIVPPASARALAMKMPGATVVEPDCGHISMMIGKSACEDVWKPLEKWILLRRTRKSNS